MTEDRVQKRVKLKLRSGQAVGASLLVLALGLLALGLWQVIAVRANIAAYSSASRLAPLVSDMDFVSQSTGWIICTQGKEMSLFRTSDSGVTWREQLAWQPRGRLGVGRLHFFDERHGFVLLQSADGRVAFGPTAAANTPEMYMTHDGGYHWDNFPLPLGSTPQFAFPDSLTGWILSNPIENVQDPLADDHLAIYRTVDAGASWSQIAQVKTSPELPPAIYTGVAFANDQDGWLGHAGTTAEPLAYVTHDGGITWKARTFLLPDDPVSGPLKAWAQPAFILGSNVGVMAIRLFPSPADTRRDQPLAGEYVTITRDGGRTWAKPARLPIAPSIAPLGVWQLLDATHWWTASLDHFWRTEDGGADWIESSIPLQSGLIVQHLNFVDPHSGWLLAGSLPNYRISGQSAVFRTESGGAEWTAVNTPSATALRRGNWAERFRLALVLLGIGGFLLVLGTILVVPRTIPSARRRLLAWMRERKSDRWIS